jgi:hypothetical protein
MYLRIHCKHANKAYLQEAILLQNLGLGGLWVAKIHHLIQQLVDDHEIISYTLLLQLLEVLCEDLHHLMQEQEDLGGICVSFGEGEEVEIVVADVEVVDAFAGEAWGHGGALVFGLAEQNGKLLDR